MSKENLQKRINDWIEANTESMIADAIALTKIKSVGVPNEGGYPYGRGCAQALDLALELSGKMGFDVYNGDYYYGTAILKGKTDAQLGVFGHLDVVPEGNLDNWNFDPYDSVLRDGYILGRGSSDNKCPAIASLYTLKCIKELELPMKHSVLLFLGCDEESGMSDIEYFWKTYKAPAFSFTSDGRYSLCYGEKGILTAELTVSLGDSNLLDFSGGEASNMVPDYAYAVIGDRTVAEVRAAMPEEGTITGEDNAVKIETHGIAAHAAFPEGSISAIQKLAALLLRGKLLNAQATKVVTLIAEGFKDYYGVGLNINFEDKISGKTTAVGGKIRVSDGVLCQWLNVRYAIETDQEQMIKNLTESCKKYGYQVVHLVNNQALYMSLEDPGVHCLHETANEFLDEYYPPYVMGGGTYARKIPNAVAYGPTTRKIDATDSLKYGEGHQPNEGMKVSDMTMGVRIYVNALLRLDEIIK